MAARHLALLAIALLLSPGLARARCNGLEQSRWSIHQTYVMLLNPMGLENNARLGLCFPLYPTSDDLLADNHFEVGVSSYLSPIYAVGGGYLQVGLSTFFFVRAELNAIGIWPLPLAGSGYYARSGYQDTWSYPSVPADLGASASGWNLRIFAVLRGNVDLSPVVGLFAADAFWIDHDEIGQASHWVSVRNDLILAQSDWLIANEANVVMSVRTPGGPSIRFGAYDAMRFVPASGYGNNQLGPIVQLAWDRPDTHVAALEIFIRLGVYTHHRVRELQAATMAGIDIDWDLGGL